MRFPVVTLRTMLSGLLVVAIAAVFTFSSLAAATDQSDKTASSTRVDSGLAASDLMGPTGTFICPAGGVINGNNCRSGATVLNGSVVGNPWDELASVDMGRLGRLYLQPRSSVKIVFADGFARLEPTSPNVQFVVTDGALRVVDSTGTQTLGGGDSGLFKGKVVASMSNEAVVTVAPADDIQPDQQPSTPSGQNPPQDPHKKRRRYIAAPWWSYLIFAGVGGGIAGGINAGNSGGSNSAGARVSDPRP